MKEFPLEDYLTEEKAQAKPPKKRPENRKSRGQEVLRAIELYDMSVRELHRPLDSEEARKLEMVIDESQACSPLEEDKIMIHKIMDMIARESREYQSGTIPEHGEEKRPAHTLTGNRANPFETAFKLGMAYERLAMKQSA